MPICCGVNRPYNFCPECGRALKDCSLLGLLPYLDANIKGLRKKVKDAEVLLEILNGPAWKQTGQYGGGRKTPVGRTFIRTSIVFKPEQNKKERIAKAETYLKRLSSTLAMWEGWKAKILNIEGGR